MKTAFITGSATGIGAAIVQKLLDEGWMVYGGYRSTNPQDTSWYGHKNAIPVKCDVTNIDEVKVAAELIERKSGQLDLLLNNAAYPSNSGVIEAVDMKDYRKTMEINFWGPLNVLQACTHLIKKAKGKIVNTGSASVYLTIPMGSSYPVSKTALTTLTNHLRLEMAPFGVQVTTLHPGGVETPMTDLGSEVAEQQWQAIPANIRAEYAKHFLDGASAVGENFKLYSPETFANKVYQQVIKPRKVKPSYLIGPGVAPLPWLHRLLPVQQVQNIWAKMFSV
ncbi:MAG: SDR family NAD(P)-dependent oxidoreductase [Pseudomonadales bacterium]|nr:SDR family NAD(P)-dependent oxidoreductase [Pseudomonadales bacterium]